MAKQKTAYSIERESGLGDEGSSKCKDGNSTTEKYSTTNTVT